MKEKIRMSDIADRLGVSKVTVSKALADKDGVSAGLREKIKQLAEELGYTRNHAARSLKGGRNYNVGVIIPERFLVESKSFYWMLFHAISDALASKGYYGILEILSAKQENEPAIPAMLELNRVDGIIMLGQAGLNYITALQKSEVPLVCMDFYRSEDDIDTVVTDNFFGALTLTDYLIRLGHLELGFVGNLHTTNSIQDRFLGFLKALILHGIPLKDEWILSDREDSGTFIPISLPQILPTAFVCNCDETAFRLIQALNAESIRVPEDVSVVGFDDYLASSVCKPPLTTVAVDMQRMASTAATEVIRKICDNRYHFGRRIIGGHVIYRESAAPPR